MKNCLTYGRVLLAALLLTGTAAYAGGPLHELNPGGTFNPATDKVVTVRNGGGVNNPEVQTTLGTAAAQPSSAFLSSTGPIPPASLPTPAASALGGVQSAAAVANQFLTGITTLGVPTRAQPAFTDLAGNIAVNQMNGGTGASATTAWFGDGTWKAVAGGSVSLTTSSPNLVFSPTTITGTGTINITNPVNLSPAATVAAADMGATLVHTANSDTTETLPATGTTGFGTGAAFGDLNVGTGTLTRTNNSPVNGSSKTVLHQRGFDFVISAGGGQYYALGSPGFGTVASNTMMKFTADLSGAPTAAVAGTDYQAPITLTTAGSSGPATFNSGTGVLNIPSYAGGGGAGGGTFNWAQSGFSPAANTYYAPIGGGGSVNTTEAAVNIKGSSAFTVANLQANVSGAPGSGNSYVFTLRKNGASQALTCTIANTATSCQDLTNTVSTAQGDLLDWQITTSGSIAGTPTVGIMASNGSTVSGNISPVNVTASGRITAGVVPLTISGAAVATDASLGNYFYVTLTNAASTAVSNPTNPADGQIVTYEFTQNGSGSNLVTWGTAFTGCASGLPTLSTAAGKVDIIGFRYSARLSKWLLLNSTGLGC